MHFDYTCSHKAGGQIYGNTDNTLLIFNKEIIIECVPSNSFLY